MSREHVSSTWSALGALPRPDLPPERALRVLEVATAALVTASRDADAPRYRAWGRRLESSLLAVAGAGWLVWVGGRVLALAG